MHAEEEAGSHQTICQAQGLALKVRQSFTEEEARRVKADFEKFAAGFDYAAYKKELLLRMCEAIGVPKEVVEAGRPGTYQAKPKRRSGRRRARWG